jgi:ankyrin repeat protein
VSALIEGGADVNAVDSEGRYPLHIAAANGFADILRILLNNNALPNAKNAQQQTPLCCTVLNNHVQCVSLLLDAAVDGNISSVIVIAVDNILTVDATDSEGRTSLYHAASRGHLECVSLLIATGAQGNMTCVIDMTSILTWCV